MTRRPALFLDRDGTLIRDEPYRDTPKGLKLLPHVARGLRAWAASGFVPVIVTNQSGLARGLFTRKTLNLIHARLLELLRKNGVQVAAVYVCPHLPEGKIRRYARRCSCRKPKPGLLKRAARELRLDLRNSVMVGDSPKDVKAGKAAGARALLLGRDAGDLLDAWRRFTADSSGGRRPAGTTQA
jgi:D-glycero-D-manno-heptose 1,7-bisphosphate phosphatase